MSTALSKNLASYASRTALTLGLGLVVATGIGPSQAADQSVHPLPFGQEVVRFSGEMARASYQVYLSPSALSQPIAFQLAPTSAISVMPEASWIHVDINGNALAPVRLGADRATTLQRRPIGPQMLQTGWNTVTVSVDQRHRVDCSYPATFELWTHLDAASTGLVMMEPASSALTPADMVAMPLNDDGRLPLHAILPANASQAQTQALADALAVLALAVDADAPHVSVSHDSEPSALNVRLDDAGAVAANSYALARDDDGLVVTLGGATQAHWDSAIKALAAGLSDAAADKPIIAQRTLEGADRFTLADLGLPSQEFSGRHFEQHFALDLPNDFLAADVGRAEIRLAGGYTDGLAEQAELSIQVNGALAASIALDARKGEVFSDRSVYIDLGHFRPGRNDIAILADLSHAADASCDVGVLTSTQPRFLLLDETSVSFPNFARLGQLPRLAPGLGQDLLGSNGLTRIHVPHPDVHSISAATALRVRLALDLDTASGVALSFDAPDSAGEAADNAIVVAALSDVPRALSAHADLPVQAMEVAWIAPGSMPIVPDVDGIMTASIDADAPQNVLPRSVLPGSVLPSRVLPAVQPLPQSLGVVQQSAPAAWSSDPVEQRLAVLRQELSHVSPSLITTASVDADQLAAAPGLQALPPRPTARSTNADLLRERWQDNVSDQPELLRSASALGARFQAYVTDMMGERKHTPDISAQADLVIQQMASSSWSDNPLTLITASEPARLEAAMQTVTQPQYWQALEGSRAVFSASAGLDVSSGLADTHFVITHPASIPNWRLVLAGYYSNNPIVYSLAILLIAAGLGIVCGRAIGRSGQGQNEGQEKPEQKAAAHA